MDAAANGPLSNPCRPLAGVRVLELAQVMAGPVTGLMLADLGAEVIKVEKLPHGDDTRSFNSNHGNDVPAGFQILNRGKKSLALDLKHPEGLETLMRLVRGADVLTENFRPGTMEKLGIGSDALLAVNPRLIICSITGYGTKGPLADRGGFDALVGNPRHDNSRYCFAKPGEVYLVYLPSGGAAELQLDSGGAAQTYLVHWFNPRTGGAPQPGGTLRAGETAKLVAPSNDDWLAWVKRR